MKRALLFIISAFVVSGCQTVTQSATPAMFEIKERLSNGTIGRCSSKMDRRNKVRFIQFTDYEFAEGNTGWVRANGNDFANHLEGTSYLNVHSGEVRCYPNNIVPPSLPTSWKALTEAKATELLYGTRTINATQPTIYQSKPARPRLDMTMQGTVECTDLRVKVPVKISTSMVESNGSNIIKLWFRSQLPRYTVLNHEYTLTCGLLPDDCKGRFENDKNDGYLVIDDGLIRLELNDSGQTCVYRND